MKYSKIWDKYQGVKKLEGKAFSSHSQIRRAIIGITRGRSHEVRLRKIDKVFLLDRINKTRITTFTQLMLEKPDENYLELCVTERTLQLYSETNRTTIGVSRVLYEETPYNQKDLARMKEIGEDEFRYLWEKAGEGIERMFQDFRFLTPCVIGNNSFTPLRSPDDAKFMRILDMMGIKLATIPKNVTRYELFDNPFIFEDKILISEDSKNFLEAQKKYNNIFGFSNKDLNILLGLFNDLP